MSPRFSLCVPNFNYAHYLGETLSSALDQSWDDLEVVVCDNASTDASVKVIEAIEDPRVHLTVNRQNVGFAANLDRAVRPARGDWILLLSSDDLILPGALDTYARLIDALGDRADRAVLSATCTIIDADGRPTGRLDPPPWCWGGRQPDPALSDAAGAPVLRMPAQEVLARSLRSVRNPLWFVATAYPRARYDEIEGYRSGSLINPDKIFNWRLIAHCDEVLFIDAPQFGYRVHGGNQTAQQTQSGALKHLVDQYVYTFTLEDEVLERAGVTRDEFQDCFFREDIQGRALQALGNADGVHCRRILDFGKAAYPALYRRRPILPLLRLASRTPRLAARLANLARRAI